MFQSQVLKYIRCPEDHSELTVAAADVLQQVNEGIRAGRVTNRGGRTLEEAIETGLIRAKGDVLYAVLHGIPLLLRDEGILLNQFARSTNNNHA